MSHDDMPNEWWRIDPDLGARLNIPLDAERGLKLYLGAPLHEAQFVASNIWCSFARFSREEGFSLLIDREVPVSIRPYPDAAAELLESIDDLWSLVDEWSRNGIASLTRSNGKLFRDTSFLSNGHVTHKRKRKTLAFRRGFVSFYFTLISSISKIKHSFGPIFGGLPRSP